MYTDDIALILIQWLNLLAEFCKRFKLLVNELKTKVLIFKNDGKLSPMEKWYYKGAILEVVNRLTYVIYYSQLDYQ